MRRGFRQSVSAVVLSLMIGVPASSTELAGLDTLVQFNFQETSLSEALLAFTDITGLGLVFDSRLVIDKAAPRLRGAFSAKLALDILLEDSGLEAVDVGGDTIAIVRKKERATVAEARYVQGQAQPETLQYDADSFAIIDELLVVATRVVDPAFHKFSSGVSVQGDDIRLRGMFNVSDYLFQLPSMLSNITAANSTVFGTPAGLNLADLRGLGGERTLVLVNGRRFIPTFGGSGVLYGVDLNGISASLIDRIDVINGGASTSYGGEAVSGVVNFVLQNDLEGFQGAAQLGLTERIDRHELLGNLSFGTSFADGKGHVVASLTVDDQGGLRMADREVTSNPSGYVVGPEGELIFARGYGTSNTGVNGRILFYVDEDDRLQGLSRAQVFNDSGTAIEDFDPSRLDHRFNFARGHSLFPSLNRVFATLNGHYDIASGHRLIIENSFAGVAVDSQLAPVPLRAETGLANNRDGYIYVPTNSPFFPEALRNELAAQGGANAKGVLLQRRIVEVGPRTTDIQRQTYRSLIGLQGMLAPDWSYDVYLQYGRNTVHELRGGLVDMLNYQASITPEICARTEGCSLFNPFGSNQMTPEQIDFITAPEAERNIRTSQLIISAAVSGPLTLFAEESGGINMGAEFRHEGLKDEPDRLVTTRPVSASLVYPGSDGGFDAIEGYVDLSVPITTGRDWFEELSTTFGARVSNFSNTGTIYSWHAGGYWEPMSGLSFRVSYQYGERAPNLAELYTAGPSNFVGFEDPCANLAQTDTSTLAVNCRSAGPLGVPEGFKQATTQVDLIPFGNAGLEAERSRNFSVGGMIDTEGLWHSFPGRLRLSADFFQVRIEDYIVNLDATQLLDACYQSENLSSQFCGVNPSTGAPFIQRNQLSQELQLVTSSYINAGQFWFDGFDVELQYHLDNRWLGNDSWFDEITFTGLFSQIWDARFLTAPDKTMENLTNTAQYPGSRFQASLTLSKNKFSIDWDLRYRSGASSTPDLRGVQEARLPSIIYNDLSVSYDVTESFTFYAGIRNMFDIEAPRVLGGSVGDTLPQFYDTIGRRLFFGAVFDF